MKKVVKGNDFTLRVPVMKVVDGERVRFPLPGCTDIMVNLVNAYRRVALEWSIDVKEDNVLLARVEGDRMGLGTYALEVKGKLFGNDWRSNEYEQLGIVDNNASADTVLSGTDEGEPSVDMDTAIIIQTAIQDVPLATEETAGAVIVGDGLAVDDNGRLCAAIHAATAEKAGLVKPGAGLTVADGVLTADVTEDALHGYVDSSITNREAWVKGPGENAVMTVGCRASHGGDTTKGATAKCATAEGELTVASKDDAHAEGYGCEATGFHAHAEGYMCKARGNDSHAEGSATEASDNQAHAEGNLCRALAPNSHAEGEKTTANDQASHSEGYETQASGLRSHAEGDNTQAIGSVSHAEGHYTTASGSNSHAEGIGNIEDKKAIHSVGIGYFASSALTRKNAEYIYNNVDQYSDVKNGYKYLLGVGGYDGMSTDTTKYKSVQEVIAGLERHAEDSAELLAGKADLVDGKVPLEQLGNIDTQLFVVVDALPTEGIKENKIYLVPLSGGMADEISLDKAEAERQNVYVEYVYVDGAWEELGRFTPTVDLSGYATKTELDAVKGSVVAVEAMTDAEIDAALA